MGIETEFDDAPDISVTQHTEGRSASIQTVESNRLVPTLVALCAVGLVLAGLALGVAFWALREADRAQMRADLLQLEVESFKNVLHAARLPTSAHLPGEHP